MSMTEIKFIEWFARFESDCEEARADMDERFERLLKRTGLAYDDPRIPYLRDFLFNDYEPI